MSDEDDRHQRLEQVYGARGQEALEQSYADWALHYDSDLFAMGYLTPWPVAALTARYLSREASPILDVGAGTGLLGYLLGLIGFRGVVGIDMSEEMLAEAAKRGYAEVKRQVLGEPLDFEAGSFAAAVSSGTFTAAHAPPEALGDVAALVKPGGYVIFTLRVDGAVGDPYWAVCEALTKEGKWELVEESGIYKAFLLTDEEVRSQAFVFRVLT